MAPSTTSSLDTGVPAPYLSLSAIEATRLTALAPTGTVLPVDGSARPHQHPLGVCHQVSQLLLLRRAGVHVCLHHVHPILRRCLQQLRVAELFSPVS